MLREYCSKGLRSGSLKGCKSCGHGWCPLFWGTRSWATPRTFKKSWDAGHEENSLTLPFLLGFFTAKGKVYSEMRIHKTWNCFLFSPAIMLELCICFLAPESWFHLWKMEETYFCQDDEDRPSPHLLRAAGWLGLILEVEDMSLISSWPRWNGSLSPIFCVGSRKLVENM